MKLLTVLSLFTLSTLGMSQTFETFFSNEDIASLEQLVAAAQTNDAAILSALAQIDVLEQSTSLEGRLTESLNITAGAGLEGNFYDQASPSYSISISTDVMDLITGSETRRILDIQLDAARVRAVEAFVGYKVATNTAEAAARAVEASEAAFQVTSAQYTVGDAILANQIAAQGVVAQSAVNLLTANGQVIVALEQLASVTGLTTAEVALIVGNASDRQAIR